MDSANDLDGVDFKPFFDMVVGVLFILLILISAQLFFSQFQDQSDISPQERIEREWREEIAGFLDRFARALHDRGLEVRVDRANNALGMPLGLLANAGDDGLPRIASDQTQVLGQALNESLGCVTGQAKASGACPASGLLHLARAEIQMRLGAAPELAGLPQARYGRLLESLFAATLLQGTPDLLRESGRDGDVVLRIV